jgi:hypothetical protein
MVTKDGFKTTSMLRILINIIMHFFIVLNFLNFILFLIVVKFYTYKAEISDSIKVLTEELRNMAAVVSNQED